MNFIKRFSLLSALLVSWSFASAADDIYVADFVLDPSNTDGNDVNVYIELDALMKNKAVSIDLILPTGYSFATDEFDDPIVTMGPDITYSMAQPAILGQRLKLSSIGTKITAGKHLYATCKVIAGAGAESGTITIENRVVATTELENTECVANVLESLTIGAGGYSSYSVCAPVKVTGAKVMFGTLNGDVLTIAGDGDVVPANTGVILKGTEGATVTLEPAETAPTTESALAPAVLPTTVQANKTMVLSTVGGVTGFYVFSGTTIPGNKAYLPSIPSGSRVRIEEEGATGIESIEAETNGFNYNLMGQQVKSQKGIMIENGKKVIRF